MPEGVNEASLLLVAAKKRIVAAIKSEKWERRKQKNTPKTLKREKERKRKVYPSHVTCGSRPESHHR